jgi:Na+-driven multidrug efflux pump
MTQDIDLLRDVWRQAMAERAMRRRVWGWRVMAGCGWGLAGGLTWILAPAWGWAAWLALAGSAALAGLVASVVERALDRGAPL